jgi:DNA-binding response OmpR family regulator
MALAVTDPDSGQESTSIAVTHHGRVAIGGGMRVLLIEDDPDDRVVVRHLTARLNDQPCVLTMAETLAAGLEKLADAPFDAVLLDMRLPDADGLDGLRKVRNTSADAAIVILTGMEDERLAHEALRSGAQDYLVKGRVTSSSIERALRYAIERVRGEQARQEAEALRAVTRLALAAAHEINNPLTIVLGHLQLLAGECERASRMSGRIAQALDAVDRIARIVDLMGRITRIETQRFDAGLPEILDLCRSAGLEGELGLDRRAP